MTCAHMLKRVPDFDLEPVCIAKRESNMVNEQWGVQMQESGHAQEGSQAQADVQAQASAHVQESGQAQAGVQVKESGPALMRTPKSMRMSIGLFGRRNVGKSSILNAITNQQISIVSDHAGTTTDPVDKPMELLPLGPVLFVDTAGVDDEGSIGELRVKRTSKVFDRCDLGIVVTEAGFWGAYEDEVLLQLQKRDIPVIIVFNKMDAFAGGVDACKDVLPQQARSLPCVCMTARDRQGVADLRTALLTHAPAEFVNDPKIIGDIVEAGSTVILVIPIDKEAPKGRIILPQVQVLRDLLDAGCMAMCVRETELAAALENLAQPPALVVTDSQAFAQVAAIVPDEIPLTGFSVAFARFKGDLATQALGTLAIASLTPKSRVLIAESCTHHPIEEDIGTVKIPNMLRARVGADLVIDHVRGVDFPEDLSSYDLVIHCGGCTFNRRAILSRIQACVEAGVPVSNYGLTLAYLTGVFERSIRAFPGISELIEARQQEIRQ